MALATELLRRARLEGTDSGVWEAADVQWWSRRPRVSDDVMKPFWIDDGGPAAGVLATCWRDDRWQIDPVMTTGTVHVDTRLMWSRATDLVSEHASGVVDVTLRDDDATFTEMVVEAGFAVRGHGTVSWMSAPARPRRPLPEGFTVVDRAERAETPHPMRVRNGSRIAERLLSCSLYDAHLDLAVETTDGRTAGYSLYWFDPITRLGYVEPMRVENEFHGRGLATAMLLEGVDRLTRRGAERIKIYESEAAAGVYRGAGFRPAQTVTTYRASV